MALVVGGYYTTHSDSSSVGGVTIVGGLSTAKRGRARRYDPDIYGMKRVGVPAWFLFRGIGVKFDRVEIFPVVQVDRHEVFVWKRPNAG